MTPIVVTNSSPAGRLKRVRGAAAGGVTPFFSDDFAGLQRNDANGFTWGSVSGSGVSMQSFDGYDCIRFRYTTSGNQENRYDMGRYLNEFWKEFYIHIPSNFTLPATGNNNKLWQIWRDTYSDFAGGTQQVGMEYWNFSGSPQAFATGRAMSRKMQSGSGQYAITDIVGDANNQTPLIGSTGPITIDSWNRVRIAAKGSSAFGVSDGYYKVWFNDTLYTNVTSIPLHNTYSTPTDVTFRNGYFMGYANMAFAAQTDFHIRGVKFYDTDPGWV